MQLDISVSTLFLLVLGHLVAIALSVGAAVKEYRGQRRDTLIGAYLYVAFISVLSILVYAPAFESVPNIQGLSSTMELVRNMAIAFFVAGLGKLLQGNAKQKKTTIS